MAVQGMQALLFFQAFGVYAPFWMAEFGWSRTTISLIHSLHRTESGLLGPAHGWLLQRFSPQRVMVGGMVLVGLGFIALGFVQGFSQFIVVFLVMSIGSSLSGFMSLMTMIVNWFERRRSRAMALVGLGMSVGGLLIPALAWLLVNYGWRPVAIGSGAQATTDDALALGPSSIAGGLASVTIGPSIANGNFGVAIGLQNSASGQFSGNTGIAYGDGRGRLHVAGQLTDQDHTNRARPYRPEPAQDVTPAPHTGNNPGLGEVGFVYGDPQVQAASASANTEFAFGEQLTGYASAIASNRDIVSFAFYRSRTHSNQGELLSQVYPDGFVPQINQVSRDRSLAAGLRGWTDGGWNWDLGYSYGQNDLEFYTRNSINYALGTDSPRRFYDGTLEYTQHVVNLDLTRSLELGLAYPATLSLGAEHRREEWTQTAGEPASYAGSGAQGFGGFTPLNAGSFDRSSSSVYTGLEADVSERFSAGVAARYEDYDDFGSELSGKLSARFAFSDQVALRGTVATGFRAPALGQQYYQAVTSNIIDGVFYESGTFRTSSAAAQALGAEPLQAETSLSYGLGLVLQPIDRLYVTIDAYRIDIDDRIVLSSNLVANPAVTELLAGLGISNVTSARYFTNAVDTRTRGVDVVASYAVGLQRGTLNLTAGHNYNRTELTRIAPNPAELEALGVALERIGRDEQGRIEEGYPRSKTTLSADWNLSRWDFNLGATRYGSYTTRQARAEMAARDQTFDAKWLLDASASYRPDERWVFTLGADNVLNEYPDENIYPNSTIGQFPYNSQSPFGFNGAYVYGRIGYRW